jgi:hypothetical protein
MLCAAGGCTGSLLLLPPPPQALTNASADKAKAAGIKRVVRKRAKSWIMA